MAIVHSLNEMSVWRNARQPARPPEERTIPGAAFREESFELAAPVTSQVCPVTHTLAWIGSKWTPLLIHRLRSGVHRYSELQKALPGISPKLLADRLRLLEEHHVVIRRVTPDTPPRVDYRLTARGRELSDILQTVVAWTATSP
jgi:DNA-binding HxlR family transcriptional regulator